MEKSNKKNLITAAVLAVIMTFMEMTALPAALFVNIQFKDIEPVYFALMANFLIAFLLCGIPVIFSTKGGYPDIALAVSLISFVLLGVYGVFILKRKTAAEEPS